jgi:Calcineurin-like phosphoesterase
VERKTLTKVAASSLLLCCLALGISCDCLCRSKPTTIGTAPSRAPGQAFDGKPVESSRFVVSGDSRNCGDVIMPAIAAGAKRDGASFYWHLGDLRAIYDFDQDMVQAAALKGKRLNIIAYENDSWDDFKRNQIAPFENIPIPFYLGIGNHEATIPPKTRCEFVRTFAALLDRPELQDGKSSPAQGAQTKGHTAAPAKSKAGAGGENQSDAVNVCVKQCADCAKLETKTYYHWSKAGVDFIYLDNASDEQFDRPQLDWFDRVLQKDKDDKSITTVVVGMHKALPWSVTCDHSMNESKDGTRTGEEVYRKLLALGKGNKKVYVLASHSHYFMKDIFNTDHWRTEGVLPGWIIGTAGAERYPLPPKAELTNSKTYTYGYLLARVFPNGIIDFAFTELKQGDIPTEIKNRYTEPWISEACFDGNRKTDKTAEPDYCKESAAQKQ